MIIPVYISMPAADYPQFIASDEETRIDTLDERDYPSDDIDKTYIDTHDLLVEILDADTAHAIVYGTHMLDDEMYHNSPEDVARLAEILNNIDHDQIEDSLSIFELTDIYNDAHSRGDAIITSLG